MAGTSAVAGDEISAVAGAVTVSVLVSEVSLGAGVLALGAKAGGELDADRTEGKDAWAELSRASRTAFLPTL